MFVVNCTSFGTGIRVERFENVFYMCLYAIGCGELIIDGTVKL